MSTDHGITDGEPLAQRRRHRARGRPDLAICEGPVVRESERAGDLSERRRRRGIDVQFNIGAGQVGDDVHEVVAQDRGHAPKREGQVAFLVDLSYAGLFGMRNVPDEQIQPFLLGEAPRLLFPFARRVLADAVRDGGFPPLLLEPIDFGALYHAAARSRQQASWRAGEPPARPDRFARRQAVRDADEPRPRARLDRRADARQPRARAGPRFADRRRFVGAGFASDAFLIAFRLPNMFRALFAEGAFSAAFIPMFNRKVGDEGRRLADGHRLRRGRAVGAAPGR